MAFPASFLMNKPAAHIAETPVSSIYTSVDCRKVLAAQAAGADPPPLKLHQKAKSTPSVKWP